VNFILKRRATRYIAAGEEAWLYPEQHGSVTHWSKLDDDWFLFPNLYHVDFSGGAVVGYRDGSSWVVDEYGRPPGHPEYQDKEQLDREFATFHKAQRDWAIKREGCSLARSHDERADVNEMIRLEDLAKHRRPADRSLRESQRPHAALAEVQEPGRAGGEARG
jgi:hypothetical protein